MANVVLSVQPTATGVSLTWSEGPASFPPYELEGDLARKLADAAAEARTALGVVVESIHAAAPDDQTAADSIRLAQAGYQLYKCLFRPAADQRKAADAARDWLNKLTAEKAVERFEIVADGMRQVPWNLVYDRQPDEAAFREGTQLERWRPFWGLRYDLSAGRRVQPLRRMPTIEKPRVLIVADSAVADGLPGDTRELLELAQVQGWTVARTRAELAAAVRDGRPDVLYWLGHTEAAGLVLGEDVITPRELTDLLEGDDLDGGGRVGGIAFLNACGTAGESQSGSFLDALHALGLSGLVGTEQETIDTFAAPLGLAFLRGFIVRGDPLGRVMRELRGQVPLGLLYGSYCPPIIRVAAPGQEALDRGSKIVAHQSKAGTKLGRTAGTAEAPATTANDQPLPDLPYRSLQSYRPEDRALLAGRDDDVLRFARLLDDPGTRLLILHGESGVGKTSFLRAGVVPYLEDECVGYRFARDRSKDGADPVVLIRATNDLSAQLAAAACDYCARPVTFPTPTGETATVDLPELLQDALGGKSGPEAVRAAMAADPDFLGRLLAGIAAKLPYTPVLVIDQAEEVFTLARTPADEAARNRALDSLRRAAAQGGGFKLVMSLRTEYHGRLVDRLRKGGRDTGVRAYLLTDFGLDDLVDAITRPTAERPIPHSTEVPFEKYGFKYADGVAEEIARQILTHTTNRHDSVLPLAQVICGQLYELVRGRADRTIRAADFAAIGGVSGGMKRNVEGMVAAVFPRPIDRRAFRKLLTHLFLRQPDGTLTTALVPADALPQWWTGRTPLAEVLELTGRGDRRLLRLSDLRHGTEERPYVSLGHDALAKVAARWQDDFDRRRRVRNYVFAAAAAIVISALSLAGAYAANRLKEQADKDRAAAVEQGGIAEERRVQADLATAAAKAATIVAEQNQQEADEARAFADQERDIARRLQDAADRNKERAERHEYLTAVRAAGQLWNGKHHGASVELLEHYHPALGRPTGGEPGEFPGFEWAVQWRRLGLMRPGYHVPGSQVLAVAWSPDGRRLTVAASDGTIRLWDWDRPDEAPRILRGHDRLVLDVKWSPDGTRMASSSTDQTVRIWDADGKPVGKPLEHKGSVKGVAWSPDGKRLATCGTGGMVLVWTVDPAGEPPEELQPFRRDQPVVMAVAWAPDTRLAACGEGGMLRVWPADLQQPVETREFSATVSVMAVAWSPTGRLACGAKDGTVKLLDAAGKPAFAPQKHDRAVFAVAWSDDGRLATGCDDNVVRVWNSPEEPPVEFHGHNGAPWSLAWAKGGLLASGSSDGTARVWNPRAATGPVAIAAHQKAVHAVAWSADGGRLATGSADGTAHVWAADGKPSGALPERHPNFFVWAAAWSKDGRLATGSGDGRVRVWTPGAGKPAVVLAAHPDREQEAVFAVAWSPDGKLIATGSADRTVRIWNPDAPAEPARTLGGGDATLWKHVRAVAWSPDGTHLASATDDGNLRLWNAGTGEMVRELRAHDRPIWALAWGADGRLASGSEDSTVRIWDAARWLERPPRPSRLAARLGLVAVLEAVTCRMPNLDSGRHTGREDLLAVLTGHGGPVFAVAWSPNGRYLASASSDWTARVWPATDGHLAHNESPTALLVYRVEKYPVWSVAWSPDGNSLALGAGNGTVEIWDGRPIGP